MMTNKTLVITGATSGLGAFLAQEFIDAGFDVVGCGRKQATVQNDGYAHIQADIGTEDGRRRLIDYVRKSGIKPYGLINNAAVGAFNQFLTTPTKKVEEIIRVNFLAHFELTRELGKLMTTNGIGRIVNIGSQTLALKTPLEAAYASSKAALETFTKIIAKEMAPFGITVNMVSPAVMETDLIKGIPNDRIEYMLAQQAIPKALSFNDVYTTIAFLMGESSRAVTGQNIYLGGVIS